jgi:hypothetical protein
VKYFRQEQGQWRLREEIRQRVEFRPLNLVMELEGAFERIPLEGSSWYRLRGSDGCPMLPSSIALEQGPTGLGGV